MKFFALLSFLCVFPTVQGQFDKQVCVKLSSNEIPWYYSSPTFNDRFRTEGKYQFRFGNPKFYKQHRVKTIQINDEQGIIHYTCTIDTSGKAVQESRLQRDYVFEIEYVAISDTSSTTVRRYIQNDWVMRVDSIDYIYVSYKNGDTTLTYSIETAVKYWRGDLINERNQYYNENYLNKDVVLNESNAIAYPFYITGFGDEDPKYFTEAFKADYDSLQLYKIQHTTHIWYEHYGGGKKLTSEIRNSHPFYKPTREKYLNESYLDGSSFIEPSVMQERMYCGNSLHRQMYYDDGTHYGYTQNLAGLRDTFYLDYYPEDTSTIVAQPPEAENESNASSNRLVELSAIDIYGKTYPRRLSTPIRYPKLFIRYTYYDE